MQHDNPIPSTHPTRQHSTHAAAWGGNLGASYLATEEFRLKARALAEQDRLLREGTSAPTSEKHRFRQLIFRILPRSANVTRRST